MRDIDTEIEMLQLVDSMDINSMTELMNYAVVLDKKEFLDALEDKVSYATLKNKINAKKEIQKRMKAVKSVNKKLKNKGIKNPKKKEKKKDKQKAKGLERTRKRGEE